MTKAMKEKLDKVVGSCRTEQQLKTAKRYVSLARLNGNIDWSDWRYYMGMIAGMRRKGVWWNL